MLDAFKNMTGGKSKEKQAAELEALIATAREERAALTEMLSSLTARSAKLTPLGKSLEQVTDKATAVTTRLDDISKRLASLDDRTKELAELDKRIQALRESARQAEQSRERSLAEITEMRENRLALSVLLLVFSLLAFGACFLLVIKERPQHAKILGGIGGLLLVLAIVAFIARRLSGALRTRRSMIAAAVACRSPAGTQRAIRPRSAMR